MSTRGDRIRQALEARGVRKQQALAAELDVHESAITRWKDDKPISLDNAVALGSTYRSIGCCSDAARWISI